jgi:hypothetical protein
VRIVSIYQSFLGEKSRRVEMKSRTLQEGMVPGFVGRGRGGVDSGFTSTPEREILVPSVWARGKEGTRDHGRLKNNISQEEREGRE